MEVDVLPSHTTFYVGAIFVLQNSEKSIGRTIPKFTQLERNKRFDNFIMLVWVQGSPFTIGAGSHPVQEAWASQDNLYMGQIEKWLQCC